MPQNHCWPELPELCQVIQQADVLGYGGRESFIVDFGIGECLFFLSDIETGKSWSFNG